MVVSAINPLGRSFPALAGGIQNHQECSMAATNRLGLGAMGSPMMVKLTLPITSRWLTATSMAWISARKFSATALIHAFTRRQ